MQKTNKKPISMKVCSGCGQAKGIDSFFKRHKNKPLYLLSTYSNHCKKCEREEHREHYLLSYSERRKEVNKQYLERKRAKKNEN